MGYPHYSPECYQSWNVVTICGSMRFYPQMLHVAERWTLENWLVLMPFVRKDGQMSGANRTHPANVAEELDRLHRKKIDLSRKIVVVSDETGYIGESTRNEIDYATKEGKGIIYEQWAAKDALPQLNEDVIAHVLADVDQVNNEHQWSQLERWQVIYRIIDGHEYTGATLR